MHKWGIEGGRERGRERGGEGGREGEGGKDGEIDRGLYRQVLDSLPKHISNFFLRVVEFEVRNKEGGACGGG